MVGKTSITKILDYFKVLLKSGGLSRSHWVLKDTRNTLHCGKMISRLYLRQMMEILFGAIMELNILHKFLSLGV